MYTLQRFGGRAAAVVLSLFVLQACAGTEDEVGSESQSVRKAELRVQLSLDQTGYAAYEPVMATVTVTNISRHAVKLLSWMLPNADLEEPLFSLVRDDGHAAPFVGADYKRPPAAPEDFVWLAAGASLTATVDLAQFYDLSATGDYQVQLSVDRTASNVETAWIEGRATAQPEAATGGTTVEGVTFTNCTTTQQGTAGTAKTEATTYSVGARNYLFGSSWESPRFIEWFGAVTSSRWNTAYQHFVAIADAFNTKPVTIDCKCKKRYYAYVYPNQPYKIYVCKVFWSAPMTGTDSRAGTLIHEMSHFNVVASTNDWVYGQSGARSLAITDPTKALNNADNHEYFAENAPALP